MEFCCSNWTISGFCKIITERNYVNWRIITVRKCPNESQFDFRRFLCFIICWVSGLIPLTFCQINIQLSSISYWKHGFWPVYLTQWLGHVSPELFEDMYQYLSISIHGYLNINTSIPEYLYINTYPIFVFLGVYLTSCLLGIAFGIYHK